MSKSFHIDELKFGYIKDVDNCVIDKDLVLMQYTGFEDKNGKEIYFDDVVKFSFHDKDCPEENYGGTAVIDTTMSNGVGILYDFDCDRSKVVAVDDGGEMEDLWEDDDLWTVEVIGNIYENPELLK